MKIQLAATLALFILLISCKQDKTNMENPLLASNYKTKHNTIPFDQIKPEHFRPAFDTAFAEARKEIDEIVKSEEKPTFTNTIEALEVSGNKLSRISKTLFNLNAAETNDSIQAITMEMAPRISEFQNDITLNEQLFSKVKLVYKNADRENMTQEQVKLLDNTYKLFVRNGADLNPEQKEEYRAITSEIAQLTVKFGENVLKETNDYILHITDEKDLSGLPEDVIANAKADAEKRELEGWVITLQYPSFGPFMKYADNRELRKEIAIAYSKRGAQENDNNNEAIVKRVSELRLTQAQLLGYSTYADFVLSNRMAESSDKVNTFLNDLLIASMPAAQKEFKEVETIATSLGGDANIMAWDWSYYSEKLKLQKFNIDDEATRPYFKLETVTQGVFDLANQLFGITLKETNKISVYHPDVKTFEVYDEKNKFLAVLYMDFFPRESKRGGAWMTDFLEQQRSNNKDIRPHVSLVFNFTKPTETKPSLITYYELRTLLHEFGHGLHGILSDVTYASLSGTNVYRDFVELPSQIMENWADQKEWLDQNAVHYETGEKMPEEMIQNIIDSKNFNSGYGTVRQLSFGMNDMAWHSITEPVSVSVEEFEVEAMKPTQLFPHEPGTSFSTGFSHIFAGGYAAGYYGYKWAEVLDADAFSLFLENGIFDKTTAASFREHILSKGGTAHPMELYVNFRGHEPSIEPLLLRSGLKK